MQLKVIKGTVFANNAGYDHYVFMTISYKIEKTD